MHTSPGRTDLVDFYIRLSVARDGADSIARQEADLRAWAAGESLTVREVWKDDGVSGFKNVKRQGFDAAIAALAAGEVSTLATWKLDRLSRRGAGQIGEVLDSLPASGGRIVSLKDGLDTSVSNSRLVIIMMSELARAESANTSLRVRAKKESSRARGEYLGGPPPFGYFVGDGRHGRPKDRKLRQHPTEAPLVRELVERLQAGESMLEVSRDWNRRGIPTRRAAKAKRTGQDYDASAVWRASTMSAFLRSPTLAGLLPEKRLPSDGYAANPRPWRHPDTGMPVSILAEGETPIITESERIALLDTLDARLRRYGRGRMPVKSPRSLLGGLIVCGGCGRSANTFGASYRCRRWHEDSDCPAPLSVSVEAVETAVKRAWAVGLAALEPDSPVLASVADHWLQKYDPAPLKARTELDSQIAEAQARLAGADEDYYVRDILDAERHARITLGIGERISELQARRDALPRPEADLGALLDPELSLPAITSAEVGEARSLLRLAIRRVEVSAATRRGARFDPRERMTIRWVGESDDEAV